MIMYSSVIMFGVEVDYSRVRLLDGLLIEPCAEHQLSYFCLVRLAMGLFTTFSVCISIYESIEEYGYRVYAAYDMGTGGRILLEIMTRYEHMVKTNGIV